MSRKGFFAMPKSPFKIYESPDLDWETPKTSHQPPKRTLHSIENCAMIKPGSQLCPSKYSHLPALPSETPPTGKFNSNELLAPIKHRRSINKSELKPKKLIFDADESEIVGLLSPISLKSSKTIVVRCDDQDTSQLNLRERKQRLRDSTRPRVQPPSDDKENRIENLRNKNKDMCNQPLKSHPPTAIPERNPLKHLRF